MKKQLAFILGRQRVWIEEEDDDDLKVRQETFDCIIQTTKFVQEIMGNSLLSTHFRALARELDVLEPKTPEDIYKSHLETVSRNFTGNVDSARVCGVPNIR